MGGYRQWTLPKSYDNDNTKNKGPKQVSRYQLIIKKWQLALKENKDVVVMMDDNIDTDKNSNHNKQYKIKNLKDMLDQHMIDYEIFQHNTKFTRYQRNQNPSTIDHIYSNCPTRLTDVETLKTSISDHCILITSYKSNDNIYHPKF